MLLVGLIIPPTFRARAVEENRFFADIPTFLFVFFCSSIYMYFPHFCHSPHSIGLNFVLLCLLVYQKKKTNEESCPPQLTCRLKPCHAPCKDHAHFDQQQTETGIESSNTQQTKVSQSVPFFSMNKLSESFVFFVFFLPVK